VAIGNPRTSTTGPAPSAPSAGRTAAPGSAVAAGGTGVAERSGGPDEESSRAMRVRTLLSVWTRGRQNLPRL